MDRRISEGCGEPGQCVPEKCVQLPLPGDGRHTHLHDYFSSAGYNTHPVETSTRTGGSVSLGGVKVEFRWSLGGV